MIALAKPRKFGEPLQKSGNTGPNVRRNLNEGVETSACACTRGGDPRDGDNSRHESGDFVKAYKNRETLRDAYSRCGSLGKTAAFFGVSKKLILTHMKRFVLLTTPFTQKPVNLEMAHSMLEAGYTMGATAKALGISDTTLRLRMAEAGFQTDYLHRGFGMTSSGYIKIRRPKHPRANKQGYVRKHVLVMEAHLGRYLAADEVPHHINGVKSDNRIENLQLMKDFEHRSFHSGKPRKARYSPACGDGKPAEVGDKEPLR